MRRKMGFTLPFQRWLADGLRPKLERELLKDPLDAEVPLEQRAMADVWKAYLAGRTNWSRPWALFALKQWIRRNIEV